MLSLAIRYLSFSLKKSQTILTTPLFSNKLTPLNFHFCRSRNNDKKEPQTKQDKSAQDGQSLHEQAIKVRRQLQKMQEQRHKHGPDCKHDHGHHHDSHHHGPDFKKNSSATNQTPPNVKLSKLSFEQLMEINSEDSLKYAQTHYWQEQQNLKELVDFKEDQIKYVEYLKKAEVEIKEKEKKLEENIVEYERQLKESEKRAKKQIEEVQRQAIAQIAKEFVEVVDGIANCRKQAESIDKSDKYIDLILQTQEIIHKIMKQYQIEQFDPVDQPYDPNFQQSLTKIPTPQGAKSNHVAKTLQPGYKIQGRLLRSAKVSIFS